MAWKGYELHEATWEREANLTVWTLSQNISSGYSDKKLLRRPDRVEGRSDGQRGARIADFHYELDRGMGHVLSDLLWNSVGTLWLLSHWFSESLV